MQKISPLQLLNDVLDGLIKKFQGRHNNYQKSLSLARSQGLHLVANNLERGVYENSIILMDLQAEKERLNKLIKVSYSFTIKNPIMNDDEKKQQGVDQPEGAADVTTPAPPAENPTVDATAAETKKDEPAAENAGNAEPGPTASAE